MTDLVFVNIARTEEHEVLQVARELLVQQRDRRKGLHKIHREGLVVLCLRLCYRDNEKGHCRLHPSRGPDVAGWYLVARRHCGTETRTSSRGMSFCSSALRGKIRTTSSSLQYLGQERWSILHAQGHQPGWFLRQRERMDRARPGVEKVLRDRPRRLQGYLQRSRRGEEERIQQG